MEMKAEAGRVAFCGKEAEWGVSASGSARGMRVVVLRSRKVVNFVVVDVVV